MVFSIFRGERAHSTYSYGGEIYAVALRVLPAGRDSISGGEGGCLHSGTGEFWVTPIFLSTLKPTWTFTPGTALCSPVGCRRRGLSREAPWGAGWWLCSGASAGESNGALLQCPKTPPRQQRYWRGEVPSHSSAFSCIRVVISVCRRPA